MKNPLHRRALQGIFNREHGFVFLSADVFSIFYDTDEKSHPPLFASVIDPGWNVYQNKHRHQQTDLMIRFSTRKKVKEHFRWNISQPRRCRLQARSFVTASNVHRSAVSWAAIFAGAAVAAALPLILLMLGVMTQRNLLSLGG